MAPPSDRPALASGEACLLHPVSIPSPVLSSISRTKPPRGNRGEARRTFRLITVLQFNEKPVSVLSVHNGRRFARLHRPSLDRASTLRRNETLRGANLHTRIHQTCWLLPSFVIRYPNSDSLAFGDLHGDGTKRLPFGGTLRVSFPILGNQTSTDCACSLLLDKDIYVLGRCKFLRRGPLISRVLESVFSIKLFSLEMK